MLTRPATWLAAGVGALGGGALATLVTLVVVSSVEQPTEVATASALAVFEREAWGIDDPANLTFALEDVFRDGGGSAIADLDEVTLRWVGVAAGNETYALRWERGQDVRICLLVDSAGEQPAIGCLPQATFIETGVSMSAFGVEVRWGPADADVWVTGIR